jgi:mono/diheme cytochrome c family protein
MLDGVSRTWFGFVCMLWAAVGITAVHEAEAAEPVSYRQEIQSLLARYCYACHGPDPEQRQADLRFDQESVAKVTAIVAGHPESSPMIARVLSADPAEVMPPPDTGHRLTEEEKTLLQRWVAEGAVYQSHWAFEPIQRPEPPDSVDPAITNPIDHFVMAEHQQQGLAASPPAQPHQLLRRVHFDLSGLPPAPEVANAFLQAPSPASYERLVESLLHSPHYGEHMAANWLDLARYADTNGFQNDFYRSQWPWRDWVIASFNRHQRFDEFLVEQMAGDMLPEPSTEQLVATGFNRNNRSVTEGGSIEEEWRIENCAERTETVATTFLGLTIGCARCHDHKYDPIERRDYYQFFAFFNNIDEQGVYNETRGNTGPQVKVPTPQQLQALSEAEQQVADLQVKLAAEQQTRSAAAMIADWSTSLANQADAVPTPTFQALEPGRNANTASSPIGTAQTFTGQPTTEGLGAHWDAIERDTAFSWSVWVHGSARGALFAKMNEDENYRGFDGIVLEDGKVKIHLIHHWNSNAIAVISQQPLAPTWQMLTVTYDGSSKAAGLNVYVNGIPVAVDVEVDSLQESIRNQTPVYLGQRSKTLYLNGQMAGFAWFDVALSPAAVTNWHRQTLVKAAAEFAKLPAEDAQRQALHAYVNDLHPSEIAGQLKSAETRRDELLNSQQTCMIMRDRAEYRPTYVLQRGVYDQPDTSTELWPSTPASLPAMDENQPANRLGLARWMVDARNPLVARVTVNRIWAQFFGRGLVETLDNFGVQGSPPSHPELLDWLADEFRTSGWNVQHIQRLIVTSRTYQQASEQRPEAVEKDPNNRWLWRGPRHRLSGEQLRDQALQVAGLLTTTIGGPSVFPYQPDGLWEELAGGANDGPYKVSSGPDLYRRGLYTYRKRTVSHPTLSTFDAPSWEICYAQRAITNTPLQSLALWNDPTYLEASRQLAMDLLKRFPRLNEESLDDVELQTVVADAVKLIYQTTLFREPSTEELQRLTESCGELLTFYRANAGQAEELVKVGQTPVDASWKRPQLAALTMLVSVIMNTDEFVTKE